MTRDGQAFVSSKLQFLFHLASFALFAFVFSWHWGPDAAKLPQSGGFGWFYKFLTFCGFNFQLLTLSVVVLSHLIPKNERLKIVADDLSCTVFPIANAISILYWGILILTMKPVEEEIDGNIRRTVTHGLQSSAPWYINLTVHLFNSIIAWVDISISERTFRTRAFFLSFAFAVGYICWSQYATSINKIYPYPFLNTMPQPQGYILVSIVSLLILYLFSRIGAKVAGHSSSAFKKTKVT
ncbi:hypothetical protein MPTK1_8g07110 [Marchantia polymorpha subsp. ruderalis]|uniref:FAR-17a/AIG1-like protein n=1 Tax=Marchantia polymorpha TaxID=3197 RepID=A0A2R6XIC3_MARPO|nr:hypothetical protein MARPO_0013s0081 [Marchantia polymorpha]PTQ45854.1 hypothetical protein MARPO_0013s0081 [Marchantia polymorpha]BBN18992.1 hypothetical protein Mp_8g07110 [Marchantia polymorpha subsp. ruderalis]BBN18993.1 hypothetical protein Mp_8g07110 [Marchantia polymorpha subsp. ruderalis]|eukprot:PTQ45853.1 hypothetical protein MARPO_0013s0081 [Marchantia polymorpha]